MAKTKPQPRKNGRRFNLRKELILTVLAMDDINKEHIQGKSNPYQYADKLAMEYRKFNALLNEI